MTATTTAASSARPSAIGTKADDPESDGRATTAVVAGVDVVVDGGGSVVGGLVGGGSVVDGGAGNVVGGGRVGGGVGGGACTTAAPLVWDTRARVPLSSRVISRRAVPRVR